MTQVVCPYCKNKFECPKNKDTKFCSKRCWGDFQVEARLTKGSIFDKSIRGWCYRHLEQKCYECGQDTLWNNKPLRLQVDHRNGDTHDNRQSNLGMICPNCHTQTETWGVKNASKHGRLKMVIGAAKMRKSNSGSRKNSRLACLSRRR